MFIFIIICLKFQKKNFDAFSSDDEDNDESLTTEDDGSNNADSDNCK